MKTIMIISAILSMLFGKVKENKGDITPKQDFYSLSFKTIDGAEYSFDHLKGKMVLIVNTASKCGYTPQFKELEQLNQKYGDKLVILGFPSNDFAGQDPGTNEQIKEFCTINYGVTFTMMERSNVKGDGVNSVFKWLTKKDINGWNDSSPAWNFTKYLIDKKGSLIAVFPSKVKPLSEEIVSKIE